MLIGSDVFLLILTDIDDNVRVYNIGWLKKFVLGEWLMDKCPWGSNTSRNVLVL